MEPDEQENSDDYNPLGNSPWDNAQGGGITGDDITGGGWPGQGYNLPGKGGSGRRKVLNNNDDDNYTKNIVGHIITISVNGVWVRTFGGNF